MIFPIFAQIKQIPLPNGVIPTTADLLLVCFEIIFFGLLLYLFYKTDEKK
jgi:hypothetical protein